MEKEIHPHTLIADFVNDYEEIIRPALEEENLDSAVAGVIGKAYECYRRFKVRDLELTKNGAFTTYEQAVTILHALSDQREWVKNIVGKEGFNKRILKPTLRNINIEVSRLDIILQGDDKYEKHRRREAA